jgi:hypothetical protein
MKEAMSTVNKIPLYLFSLALICLNISTVSKLDFGVIVPFFDIIVIFYLVLVRPLFGLWWVCFLSIWQDAITELPIGITAISYIIAIKMLKFIMGNSYKEMNFYNIIKSFVIFITIFFTIKITLLSFIADDRPDINKLLLKVFLTITIYPLSDEFLNHITSKITKKRY